MIFMGEEFNADQPFPFFCDFDGDLAEAVRKGRREEFARFPAFQDPALREKIPDPQAEATFASARLDWSACERAPHAEVLDWYRRILQVRRHTIVPLLDSITRGGKWRELGPSAVAVQWQAGPGRVLSLLANLSERRVGGVAASKGQTFWHEGEALAGDTLGPWAIRWDLETTAA